MATALVALALTRTDVHASGLSWLKQGLTTGAIQGTVRYQNGDPAEGAQVSVRNSATGFVTDVETRNGRFLVQGLEVGGPYTVLVRQVGFQPERQALGWLTLGTPVEVNVVLRSAALQLDSLTAVASGGFSVPNLDGGTATTISDSLLHHLPTLNRDVYDFVRLAPQVSTKVGLGSGGMSVGGVGFRFNQFLTNGVPERSLAGGQPPEFAGGKSLPFEAVAEYQVLVAPFDVRYGDFAGGAVNTITRSGTNALQGSLFVQSRGDGLARSEALLPYQRHVFGGLLSGPIVRDRLNFLLAADFQRLTAPMPGPFVGQSSQTTAAVPVSEADLTRLESIMQGYGLDAGTGGPVPNRTPVRNIFARMDAALPQLNSRATMWLSDGETKNLSFARGARDTTFALSSNATTFRFAIRTLALQTHTTLRRDGGGHNEFFFSHRTTHAGQLSEFLQPLVSVAVPGQAAGGTVTLVSGTPVQAQAGEVRYVNTDVRDNLTLTLGAGHILSVGLEAEWFRLESGGPANAFGTWNFLSLDSLQAGLAQRFEVTRDLDGGHVPLTGRQAAFYVGDRWHVGERVDLTWGLRADALWVNERPPHNDLVDSIFGRRTDEIPSGRFHLSPRLGFTWETDRAGRNRLRGGVGVFTGRPPLAWLHSALRNDGLGTGLVRCGPNPLEPPPTFDPDPLDPPTECAGSAGGARAGDVELLDRGLAQRQTIRAVVAWDRRLTQDSRVTLEALTTWNLADYLFVNLNLVGPQSVDIRGRTLYGTISGSGLATPAFKTTALPSVIDLQNVGGHTSTQVSARLEKRLLSGSAVVASYTWSRVRDVQTPLRVNTRGLANWASRAVSGRHEDLAAGHSLNDIPHRLVLAAVYRAPWKRWITELSVLYVGESGSPFTYLTWGTRGLGDLNADGSNANDPIYVPGSALDPDEILFTGISAIPGADQSAGAQAARIGLQRAALEEFIERSSCLRRQRRHILERNSCREPWSHTSVLSVRQRVPIGESGIDVQLDLFNFLNLLNRDWGLRRISAPFLLEHVGQVPVPAVGSRHVFRFDATAPQWTVVPGESAYQFQVGLRYSF